MPSSYSITEPHPTPAVPAIHFGRGGCGNITRVSHLTHGPTATGPASRAPLRRPPPDRVFRSGRGGAGNVHRESERAIFSFDEELAAERRLLESAAPVYHVGRGGAGNIVNHSPSYDEGSWDDDSLRSYRKTGSLYSNSNSSFGSRDEERMKRVRDSLEGLWIRTRKKFWWE